MNDGFYREGIVTGGHNPRKQALAVSMRRAPTHAEELLWERLRASRCAGLHFRRQQVIDGFIADFYCHAAGLVVEVDGQIHKTQRDRDAERDAIMQTRGLLVLRFTNDDVERRVAHVVATIAETARQQIAKTGDPEQ
jgi:very-short-patch-repair endonuclease